MVRNSANGIGTTRHFVTPDSVQSSEDQAKVLIVEDDSTLSSLLAHSVEKLGYSPLCAHSAEEGLMLYERNTIDLILLDILLPSMDGFEFCSAIRQLSNVPIVVNSSITDTGTIVKMFESGADEYITKPSQFAYVEAVIIAQLRRVAWCNGMGWQDNMRLTAGPVSLDVVNQIAFFDDAKVQLTQRECNILEFLLKRPNQPISTLNLCKAIWGKSDEKNKTLVSSLIQRLRIKVEQNPSKPNFIVTVRGYGYKFATDSSMVVPN
ncbi:MAG: response regulator transcription factor [Chloroflexota bacterium]